MCDWLSRLCAWCHSLFPFSRILLEKNQFISDAYSYVPGVPKKSHNCFQTGRIRYGTEISFELISELWTMDRSRVFEFLSVWEWKYILIFLKKCSQKKYFRGEYQIKYNAFIMSSFKPLFNSLFNCKLLFHLKNSSSYKTFILRLVNYYKCHFLSWWLYHRKIHVCKMNSNWIKP